MKYIIDARLIILALLLIKILGSYNWLSSVLIFCSFLSNIDIDWSAPCDKFTNPFGSVRKYRRDMLAMEEKLKRGHFTYQLHQGK